MLSSSNGPRWHAVCLLAISMAFPMNEQTSDPRASTSYPLLLRMTKMEPKRLSWKLGSLAPAVVCLKVLDSSHVFNLVELGVKLHLSNALLSTALERQPQRFINKPTSLCPSMGGFQTKLDKLDQSHNLGFDRLFDFKMGSFWKRKMLCRLVRFVSALTQAVGGFTNDVTAGDVI